MTASDSLFQLPPPSWLQSFRRRLRSWYVGNARDLPWRSNADPYRVWVSEIMLQQTQVATAIPYFERFMAALPTLESLAAAEEQEVLRLWEGLGYYRRARQMHQAARRIVAEHGGAFPREITTFGKLPGIGRYTAGAVLSIAFDVRLPILEANTVRLFSRLLAFDGDPGGRQGQSLLWSMAERVLPRRGCGKFNQALMELGSQVCTPRAPRCPACPVAKLCRAREDGIQHRVPAAKSRPAAEMLREAAVVVRRNGQVLLLQCGPGEWWAGLWDFPRFALEAEAEPAIAHELAHKVRQMAGAVVRPVRHLATLRHSVTRYRITLECYEAAHLEKADGQSPPRRARWVRPAELADYPLSATGRKLSRLLIS